MSTDQFIQQWLSYRGDIQNVNVYWPIHTAMTEVQGRHTKRECLLTKSYSNDWGTGETYKTQTSTDQIIQQWLRYRGDIQNVNVYWPIQLVSFVVYAVSQSLLYEFTFCMSPLYRFIQQWSRYSGVIQSLNVYWPIQIAMIEKQQGSFADQQAQHGLENSRDG